MNSTTPMIFVAVVSSYGTISQLDGNGYLTGQWIKANQPAEHIQAEIDALLEENGIADPSDWIIENSNFGLNLTPPRYIHNLKDVAKVAGFCSVI